MTDVAAEREMRHGSDGRRHPACLLICPGANHHPGAGLIINVQVVMEAIENVIGSARAARRGEAQEARDTGDFLGSFPIPGKKMNKFNNIIIPRIGRTAPVPPPEVKGLDPN